MTKSNRTEMLPYKQGDWFTVPLRDGGYAVGTAAYLDGNGIVIGYFFGPRKEAIPAIDDLPPFNLADADFVSEFGDLGLIEGKWQVIGARRDSDPSPWPMPIFRRYDAVTGKLSLVTYNDRDLKREFTVRQSEVGDQDVDALPRFGLCGAGAVELVLTAILRGEDVWAVRPGP